MTFCTPTPIPSNLPVVEYSNYISPNDVLQGCLKFFGISKEMLKNKSREREILEPRQLTTYVLCKYTSLTLERIALTVGYKDHTTVISTRSRIESLLFTDKNLAAQYRSLIKYLNL